jgi:hypothetical protein
MVVTVIFMAFFALVVGGGTMLLYNGFLSTEETRSLEEAERPARTILDVQAVAEMPRFFAKVDQEPAPSTRPIFDDALLARLERHLISEQLLAADFVDNPTIDNLYRQPSLIA